MSRFLRFNKTEGFIGAFPTYDENGNVTLRPVSRLVYSVSRVILLSTPTSMQTDEACLMREMTYPRELCLILAKIKHNHHIDLPFQISAPSVLNRSTYQLSAGWI
jgi:hypothetical protein